MHSCHRRALSVASLLLVGLLTGLACGGGTNDSGRDVTPIGDADARGEDDVDDATTEDGSDVTRDGVDSEPSDVDPDDSATEDGSEIDAASDSSGDAADDAVPDSDEDALEDSGPDSDSDTDFDTDFDAVSDADAAGNDVDAADDGPCARVPVEQRCETRAELQCIDEVYRRECFEEFDGCLVWLRSACDRGTACFEGSCASDECATRGGCASEAWCDDAIAVTRTPDSRGCLVERTRRFCPAGCAAGACLSDPCVDAACNPAVDSDRCDEDRLRVCAYDPDFRCSRWFETDCAGASQNCVRVGRRHECRELFCGDGLVTAPEECDDGNTDAEDGCDGICRVEEDFSCTGEPSVCSAD